MCAKKLQREKTLKLRSYNIVLQPVERQSKEGYDTLFKKLFDQSPVRVYRNYFLKFKSMDSTDDIVSGTLVKFAKLQGDNWYNSKTNDYENVDVDPNKHPNPKEYQYYFSPKAHRLYVQADLPVEQVKKFFKKLISLALGDSDETNVEFNVVSTKESIDRIISSQKVSKIVIRISYSNGENYDQWSKMMDDDNKASNTKTLTLIAEGSKEHPINVSKNDLLCAGLEISRTNGEAIATEFTDRGTMRISTQDSPEQTDIKYRGTNSLMDKILNLFRPVLE